MLSANRIIGQDHNKKQQQDKERTIPLCYFILRLSLTLLNIPDFKSFTKPGKRSLITRLRS